MKRIALAVLAAALTWPTGAPAYHDLARGVWGPACGGDVDIDYVDASAFEWDGHATWNIEDGERRDCRIRLEERLTSEWRCTVMLHEWGHVRGARYERGREYLIRDRDGKLVGRDPLHSRNPRSVMHPVMREVDHRCR